ncbi:hypothetical protein [Planobispora longispora]|uniref:hypothetical protein n=1 Tax=Planobispora longispora TaxID=28887 RepID=UPI0019418DAF|nr:hypothetical protein [Planobispora longispora]
MTDVQELNDPAQAPADAAAMCRIVEEVPGVRLADLLAALTDPAALQHTYGQIVEAVTTAAHSLD